jgi:putative transposase
MGKKPKVLDTIWEIDDRLWAIIEPILEAYWPRKAIGRPLADWRRVLNGILYHLRTGCQWNQLPPQFGDDSTVHRWFQRWGQDGVLERIWAVLVEHCDELRGVEWKWQAADSALGKARFGGPMWAQTPRIGRKRGRRRICSSMARGDRWPR